MMSGSNKFDSAVQHGFIALSAPYARALLRLRLLTVPLEKRQGNVAFDTVLFNKIAVGFRFFTPYFMIAVES